MSLPTITVIVPAHNEEKYIKNTIAGIKSWSYPAEIVVVNDGSSDSTAEILRGISDQYSLTVINLQRNQGKGYALMEGLKKATGDIIMFLDADLGASVSNAFKLINPIIEDGIDMTIAILPKANKKAGFGLVKNLARRGIYQLTGFTAEAPLSGQRAFRREVFEKVVNLENGFGIEVGLTIDAIRSGFKIREVEIPLNHRETGRDLRGFLHRGKEFIGVFKALISKWRKRAL